MDKLPSEFRSLRSGFICQATVNADNPALIVSGRTFTYSEVDDTARRWAARIVNSSQESCGRVGVFAYRTATSYIGALASLYAGAGFVPLNRKFPLERTRTMLEQADLDALIVGKESFPQLIQLLTALPRVPTILLPDLDESIDLGSINAHVITKGELAQTAPLTALPEVTEDSLAYLLFTSGSTGTPKGVPISQGNILSFIDANKNRYQLTASDRVTQTFDQTFDLSVFDLFMAWESGACVCSMQAIELLSPFQFLQSHNITLWFSVPSVAGFLMKRGVLTPGSMPSIRWSLFCGEALPREIAKAWQEAAPNSIVENLYGPTELTIACAAHRWDHVTSPPKCFNDIVPIGQIYPHLTKRIVDESLQETPDGEMGELCVAGRQVTSGYWRSSQSNHAKFFELEEPKGMTQIYYRTGDLVRQIDDQIVFCGRIDQQVKIGGYRIELAEVEAALRRAGCLDAVAIAWPNERQATGIVAIVSNCEDLEALADTVRDSLPGYMVPQLIERRDDFPLNQNGKVDRAALRLWMARRIELAQSGSTQ